MGILPTDWPTEDENFREATKWEKVAQALRNYTQLAAENAPGPDMFGDVDHENIAPRLLQTFRDRFVDAQNGGAGLDFDGVRPPGKPAPSADVQPGGGTGRAPEPSLLNVRRIEPERDRPGGRLSPESGGEPDEDPGPLADVIRTQTGIAPGALTADEARVLAGARTPDALRDQLAAAAERRVERQARRAAPDGGKGEQPGGVAEPAAGNPADRLIAADPALKALADANRAAGVREETAPSPTNPNTLAEAVRAALDLDRNIAHIP